MSCKTCSQDSPAIEILKQETRKYLEAIVARLLLTWWQTRFARICHVPWEWNFEDLDNIELGAIEQCAFRPSWFITRQPLPRAIVRNNKR